MAVALAVVIVKRRSGSLIGHTLRVGTVAGPTRSTSKRWPYVSGFFLWIHRREAVRRPGRTMYILRLAFCQASD